MTTATCLNLDNVQGLMKKVSINVLNKDAEHTLFTLPFEGIALSREQLNAYLGERTFESWFERRKDGAWVPMPWIARLPKGEIAIEDEFECEGAEIIVSGGKTLVFEAEEPDEDDEEDAGAPIRVTSIVLAPKPGGMTLLAFHLQVHPGLGKENLALQEHQFRHVTLTLGDMSLAERKGKQQALPLTGGETDAASTNGTSSSAKNGEASEFEAGARRQVEAFNAKPGQVVDGRSERVKERDRKGARGRAAH